jgi:hypothetical protein
LCLPLLKEYGSIGDGNMALHPSAYTYTTTLSSPWTAMDEEIRGTPVRVGAQRIWWW